MEFTPRYLSAGSFLARRDPRVLILAPVASVVIATQISNVWLMAVLVVLAFAYYASARIPFAAVATNWAFVALFVLVFAGVNGVLTGAQNAGATGGQLLFRLPLVDVPVTSVSLSYVVTIALRFVVIAATGFPMAYAIRPGDLAVAFARLGMPSRFAYGIDLTFAFMPGVAGRLSETIAAQRLRGFQRSATRNPLRKLAEVRPLMIPVTISSFVDAEDTVDALDLRGFGTARRTWVRELHLDGVDRLLVALLVAAAVATSVLHIAGRLPGVWTP